MYIFIDVLGILKPHPDVLYFSNVNKQAGWESARSGTTFASPKEVLTEIAFHHLRRGSKQLYCTITPRLWKLSSIPPAMLPRCCNAKLGTYGDVLCMPCPSIITIISASLGEFIQTKQFIYLLFLSLFFPLSDTQPQYTTTERRQAQLVSTLGTKRVYRFLI